ncbi:MAG: hypothetical protein NUW01_12735 [Gemmatimonadaceae bacterium]|nr:hypothetical protein [Gemmatimonadaceae bacterium]
MASEHECVFVEEQEPEGRLVLPPCIVCGVSAMDALDLLREDRDAALTEADSWHGRAIMKQRALDDAGGKPWPCNCRLPTHGPFERCPLLAPKWPESEETTEQWANQTGPWDPVENHGYEKATARLRELLEQAEVDTERKVRVEMRERVESLAADVEAVQGALLEIERDNYLRDPGDDWEHLAIRHIHIARETRWFIERQRGRKPQ